MRPQSIRDRLNKGGMKAPYLDEPGALKILEGQGINLAKYRATKASRAGAANGDMTNGHDESNTALIVASSSPPPKSTTTLPAVVTSAREEKIAKLRAAWANKLVPRLARLLPEGDSPKGKKHVKKILKEGNYNGPRWDDEVRAIAVFREAGIDTSNFEWANKANASRKAVTQDESAEIAWKLQQAEMARTMLEQYERHYFTEVEAGNLRRELRFPMGIPFDALNVLRAKRPKSRTV